MNPTQIFLLSMQLAVMTLSQPLISARIDLTKRQDIIRTKPGNIPYGVTIFSCNSPGTIALTYDDGPFIYTSSLLDELSARGAHVTFFVTGANLGTMGKLPIDDPKSPSPALLQRMLADGHQIAGHSWTHPNLDSLDDAERTREMTRLETALIRTVGVAPTYMRPPYSACGSESGCLGTMSRLGYHVVGFDVDTEDYKNATPELQQNAKDNFAAKVEAPGGGGSFLVLAHDIHEQTVRNLTGFMLDVIERKGLRSVTVGQCMGDPKDNWYR